MCVCVCVCVCICVCVCVFVCVCACLCAGVLKISLAGANNLVPMTGLTPCIIIVHVYTCNYSGAQKTSTPAGIPSTVNGVIVPILHPCVCVCVRSVCLWNVTLIQSKAIPHVHVHINA